MFYSYPHKYYVKYFTTKNIIIQVTIIPPNTIHLSCWVTKQETLISLFHPYWEIQKINSWIPH